MLDLVLVDGFLVFLWWSVLFLIGLAAFPLTRRLFSSWWDQGYSLSKAVGLAGVTFLSWYFGSVKILPFTQTTIVLSMGLLFLLGLLVWNTIKVKQCIADTCSLIGIKSPFLSKKNSIKKSKEQIPMISFRKFVILELFFLFCLWFWSYIKAFEPDIRSLEKFMDYGFSQTIINSPYFPPPDMWYAGGTINYYYFGHAVRALLSKLSSIDLAYGYNLMLATLFALCFTMAFSISYQLLAISYQHLKVKRKKFWGVVCGLLGAFLVTMAGNMQTIYAFTKGYHHDDEPPPFWTVMHAPHEFFSKLPESINSYWYANATRFIPYTIHEFPSYSFVVSDNHGHVLGIPFALLAIASLLSLFVINPSSGRFLYVLYGGLVGILLMTNALDGPIYFGLFCLFILLHQWNWDDLLTWKWIKDKGISVLLALLGFLFVTLPFLLNFKSFATGLAVNCPPKILENTNIGPIVFETVDKCQKSPLWMIWLLWGFFFFCGIAMMLFAFRRRSSKPFITLEFSPILKFLTVLFVYSVGLIFFAEFFYFKDIYPAHFRSNTMFKLGYQAFIMCSLMCGYVIVSMIQPMATNNQHSAVKRFGRKLFFILLMPQLFLISIYPFFSVRSYFGGLQVYRSLYGLQWFEREYPDDFQAMLWLKKQLAASTLQQAASSEQQTANGLQQTTYSKQHTANGREGGVDFLKNLSETDPHVRYTFFTRHLNDIPVIVEAHGDSYTDYNRISAFAGVPTIIGWGVHEWLWRGTYDVVAPRTEEVTAIYEGQDDEKRRKVLEKYNVKYIAVGSLERKKFQSLNEQAIQAIGQEVFRSGETVVYKVK
ncbi:MAG: DUF2298 domain-containing protein [Patescibacteria group bacterium]|nr:DUF2298 domain-containing protein [Patescibacteria group bacterium]